MANAFKDTALVSKLIVKHFENSLMLGKKVDRQLETKNVFNKVGATVNVQKPVLFEGSDGAVITAGQTEDIQEAVVPVVLAYRKKVVFTITSQDQTLSVEDAENKYFRPAGRKLAQFVESTIADAAYKGFYNFVGTPGTSPGTFLSVANAGAALDNLGVPFEDRCAFYDPNASVTLADGLKAVFPESIAKKAIEEASIGRYAGFKIYKNQSLKIHTVGADWDTGTPLVNGADQNVTYATAKDTDSQTLLTDGWSNSTTGVAKAGDKFTIAGVNSVNRETLEDTGGLAVFTVLADADSGAATGPATLSISPPIITSGAYQTVTAAPANNAVMTALSGAEGSTHRQNIAFQKNAVTLVMAPLDTPGGNVEASRMDYEGVSIRVIKAYNFENDETRCRFDILFGVKVQNGGFGVVTTS
jgi:hypothetical protein